MRSTKINKNNLNSCYQFGEFNYFISFECHEQFKECFALSCGHFVEKFQEVNWMDRV